MQSTALPGIVDVMENDSVMTSAKAESEEEAMAIARATASAFYGSRAAMFEYAVYPLSPQTRRREVGECDQILIAASGEETGQV